MNRYDAARTDAASVIAAFLARWKHTHLHDRAATTQILAQWLRLSREQTVAGSIRAITRRAHRAL